MPIQMIYYDWLIYDGARNLAMAYKNKPTEMARYLEKINTPTYLSSAVIRAMTSSDYAEVHYRGGYVDEEVIETLKDVLRHFHIFE